MELSEEVGNGKLFSSVCFQFLQVSVVKTVCLFVFLFFVGFARTKLKRVAKVDKTLWAYDLTDA